MVGLSVQMCVLSLRWSFRSGVHSGPFCGLSSSLDLGGMSARCLVFLEEKSTLKDEGLHVLSYRMPQI